MHRMAKLRGVAIAALVAVTLVVPAHADIRSFNAAIQVKDYKKAAAEAATTWPSLDKSRKDLAVIAREFGFAAYMAGDYSAAQTFADAAVSNGVDETADLQARSSLLLRLATLKATPTDKARDDLFAALTARAALPGVDILTYLGADAVTQRDFDKGDWKKAMVTAQIGEDVTSAAGPAFAVHNLQFALYKGIANYMSEKDVDAYRGLVALRLRVIDAVNGAASDEKAKDFVDFYWLVDAWRLGLSAHLQSFHRLSAKDRDEPQFDMGDRAVRLLNVQSEDKACRTATAMVPELIYPPSAHFKGMVGTVIISADFDEKGAASNAKILAAAPKETFGQDVLENISHLRISPGKNWGSQCNLVRHDKVITFLFTIH